MNLVSADLNELGERFSKHRAGRRRGRLPKELKEAVLDAVAQGNRVSDVAAACGLNPVQVYRWKGQLRPGLSDKKSSPLIRRVSVRQETEKVRAILPGGAIIEVSPSQIELLIKTLRRVQ